MGDIKAVRDPDILIEQLQALVENLELFSSQRQDIIRLSRQAAVLLEGPFETFQRLAYSEHKIFTALTENGDQPVDVATLAEKSSIHPTILESLLEYMTTQFMVEEVSLGNFKAMKLSNILLAPLFVDGIVHLHDNCLPVFNAALNPSLSLPSNSQTAFEIGQNSPTDFYTWLETHPVQSQAFHRFMDAQFPILPTWMDVIPLHAEYAASSTATTPVSVDVGGGSGHQCVLLQKKLPSLNEKAILQDTPVILAKTSIDEKERKCLMTILLSSQ